MLQVNDAKEIKNTEIAKELSLPPVKLHCSSKLRPWQTRKHCCQNIAPCVEKQFFYNISLPAEAFTEHLPGRMYQSCVHHINPSVNTNLWQLIY